MTSLPLTSIVVGDRHRKDMGDIDALAESIRANGLLHPIVVTSDHRLVAGARRLAAARMLGWSEIPVSFIDPANLLLAERDENAVRKDFTPTEAIAIGKELEPLVREQAKERQGTRTDLQPSEKFSEGRSYPETREVVGAAVGMSGPTYQRAKAVTEAAHDNPERFGDLAEEMDRTGKVTPVYEKLRTRLNGTENTETSDRVERARQMAAEGYTSRQIGATLGIKAMKNFRVRHGIDVPADRVVGRGRYHDSNRIIAETVISLEGLLVGVDLVELDDLDRSQVEGWATSLSNSVRLLNRLCKQLKEMTQ